MPGQANRPADTLSRYPLLTGAPVEVEGVPISLPSPRVSNKKLKDISDPDERALVGRAEFLVEGDPTLPGQLHLIGYNESCKLSQIHEDKYTIFSLRTNIPEEDEPEDPIIWSLPEIKAAQRNDFLLKHIIKYLEKPSSLAMMMVDPNIKDLETYILDSTGILFKKQWDPTVMETRGEEEVLVVPHVLQKSAMEAIHSSVAGGHPGPDRTCWAAKRRFYWRNMDKALKNFAASCDSCAKFKGRPHPKVSSRRYPIPDRPWHTVSIDLIGPLPSTQQRYKYILVCVDYLTRYCATAPLRTKNAQETAAALVKIFCQNGIPAVLISDNAAEFRSSLVKEIANQLCFKHVTIACYHPSSQGLVERKNRL